MGGGALAQLSLVGQQDLILHGSSPDVTFWRLQWKKPSMFSMESINQAFQGDATFGRKVICPITKSGDLLHTCWLQVTLPDLSDYNVDGFTINASADVPGIISARWTSSTTARVKLIPSTDATPVVRYDVSYNDGSTDTVVAGDDGATTVMLTGLDTSKTYTVKARRVTDSGPGAWTSTTMDVISLRWANSMHSLIRTVDLEIGGSRISRHTGTWMEIVSELELAEDKQKGFNTMIGKYPDYDLYDNSTEGGQTFFIPIQFPFCKHPGLAILIIALTYSQVNLVFDFREYLELIKSTVDVSSLLDASGKPPEATIQCYATFVYLSASERRVFASGKTMEYVFQDVQHHGDIPMIVSPQEQPSLSRKLSLDFAHPTAELIWVYNRQSAYNANIARSEYASKGNDYFNWDAPAGTDIDPVASAVIHVNGHERFSRRIGKYFRLVVPYGHHTRIPVDKKIYCYSFGLLPEEPSVTGSINFSRADTSHLLVTLDDSFSSGTSSGRLQIFARSWQVLRIQAGLGAVLFASG
jgi:hypothetical protein